MLFIYFLLLSAVIHGEAAPPSDGDDVKRGYRRNQDREAGGDYPGQGLYSQDQRLPSLMASLSALFQTVLVFYIF